MSDLSGKVVLVTGSTQGIGRITALEFAKSGATVVVTGRSVEDRAGSYGTISKTVSEVEALGARGFGVQADLKKPQDIEQLVREVLSEFGQLDILVNNATYKGSEASKNLDTLTLDDWNGHFAINVTAPFLLCQAFIPIMGEHGGGIIINTTSRFGSFGLGAPAPQGIGYTASKAALNLMTEGLAHDFAKDNITATILSPGFTATERALAHMKGGGQDFGNAQPMEAPARAAVYLASCEDPMMYSGKIVDVRELVEAFDLI